MDKRLIIKASPRKNGNTNALTDAFAAELAKLYDGGDQVHIEEVDLYDMNIKPCVACRCCQTDWTEAWCVQEDDAESVFDKITGSDLIVLATPIYSWYCTAPMKALLDRCVYAFNMYYDDAAGTHGGNRGPSLWQGKKLALIVTCGYKPDKGADLFEEGMKRYCKHSQLAYAGSLIERHLGYNTIFMDEAKAAHAKAFAERVKDELGS